VPGTNARAARRQVVHRVSANREGLIRNLFGPRGLGEQLKPFVFFDHLSGPVENGFGFPFHPHSGIATLTYQLDADVDYEDTTGQRGRLLATGLEWMQAGGGAWHRGTIQTHGPSTSGFQLWFALPPDAEEASSRGLYIPPARVPTLGNVHVLLGEYEGARSSIDSPMVANCFDVVLRRGEHWTWEPPPSHSVLWAYVYGGSVLANETRAAAELLVFSDGPGRVGFEAVEDARFLVGSAPRLNQPLVLGRSSVHTSTAALQRSAGRIRDLGEVLRREGRIPG
jgi:redox-sensitive bicupin YhaK (pirin superfamily)